MGIMDIFIIYLKVAFFYLFFNTFFIGNLKN